MVSAMVSNTEVKVSLQPLPIGGSSSVCHTNDGFVNQCKPNAMSAQAAQDELIFNEEGSDPQDVESIAANASSTKSIQSPPK